MTKSTQSSVKVGQAGGKLLHVTAVNAPGGQRMFERPATPQVHREIQAAAGAAVCLLPELPPPATPTGAAPTTAANCRRQWPAGSTASSRLR